MTTDNIQIYNVLYNTRSGLMAQKVTWLQL